VKITSLHYRTFKTASLKKIDLLIKSLFNKRISCFPISALLSANQASATLDRPKRKLFTHTHTGKKVNGHAACFIRHFVISAEFGRGAQTQRAEEEVTHTISKYDNNENVF